MEVKACVHEGPNIASDDTFQELKEVNHDGNLIID